MAILGSYAHPSRVHVAGMMQIQPDRTVLLMRERLFELIPGVRVAYMTFYDSNGYSSGFRFSVHEKYCSIVQSEFVFKYDLSENHSYYRRDDNLWQYILVHSEKLERLLLTDAYEKLKLDLKNAMQKQELEALSSAGTKKEAIGNKSDAGIEVVYTDPKRGCSKEKAVEQAVVVSQHKFRGFVQHYRPLFSVRNPVSSQLHDFLKKNASEDWAKDFKKFLQKKAQSEEACEAKDLCESFKHFMAAKAIEAELRGLTCADTAVVKFFMPKKPVHFGLGASLSGVESSAESAETSEMDEVTSSALKRATHAIKTLEAVSDFTRPMVMLENFQYCRL